MHLFFPTGGWGWNWVGDADAGFNERQPGGWVYNILPWTENAAAHDLGLGADPTTKMAAHAQRLGIAIPSFHCPSRRRADRTPLTGQF